MKENTRTDCPSQSEIHVYNEPNTPIQHKAPATPHTTGQPAATDQATMIGQSAADQDTTIGQSAADQATTIGQSAADQATTDQERKPKRSDVGPQIFKCCKCDKSFTRKDALKRHFKMCGRRVNTSRLLYGAVGKSYSKICNGKITIKKHQKGRHKDQAT